MNLNKQFLAEIMTFMITKGITLTELLESYYNATNSEIFPKNNGVQAPVIPEVTEQPIRATRITASEMNIDIEGKTVWQHMKENNITVAQYSNRRGKGWSITRACTTPINTNKSRNMKKGIAQKKKTAKSLIQELAENPKKTKMMLVNGRMTELEVSDTDLIQSSIEQPTETLETKTETLESESNTEKATENVTIGPQTETDTDTRVNDINANSDAIHGDKDDYIEKALKKFVTHSEESKKDKKPKETKSDLTVLEVCQKMNVTTHELREMIVTGEFPQPDKGNKWSAKLLKNKGII